VVLTSGANYPDALSAVYLAHELSTGVLTTTPNALPSVVADALARHGVQHVYLVGGTASVSDAVASQLSALHVGGGTSGAALQVTRIAGANRYETNSAVDLYQGQVAQTVVVATGESFADALAAGPALYATGYPLVLTPGAGLTPSIKATISALGATHAVILGGIVAVSAKVESQLQAMGVHVDQRLAGTDRTMTAAQIARWETGGIPAAAPYSGLSSLLFGASTVEVIRGDSYADGLVAGAAAGVVKDPLVLASNPATLGPGAPTFLAGRAIYVDTLQAIGGTGAVSSAVLNAAAQALS
jgi:hypothetical protein